jgi:hypothetical protein
MTLILCLQQANCVSVWCCWFTFGGHLYFFRITFTPQNLLSFLKKRCWQTGTLLFLQYSIVGTSRTNITKGLETVAEEVKKIGN